VTSLTYTFLAKAKANYSYDARGPDELQFSEGDVLEIVDYSEGDWWKTERDGAIFIVPAAYLELLDG
jgi:actin cytoskeleton-regulatory complex protein PAN1